ncbi:MAG: hypothetical protein HOP02_14495 [Methylococcaceae bacterium]|nr:hypothetical protein [Methylococcaceae bacterium]
MTDSFSPVNFAGNKVPLPSKLICPEPHNVYARTALFERLDAARTHSLIWVNAPGGSGKTILASSYLRARALTHIWYRVDGGDNDPASFFHYLSLAALSFMPP